MKRRTFMMSGAWLVGVSAGVVWSVCGAAGRPNALAVVDVTLPHGGAFAEHMKRCELPVLELKDGDIGTFWYSTLAPLLGESASPEARPTVLALTRPSDHFVLAQLTTQAGYRIATSDVALTAAGARERASTGIVRTYTPCSSDRTSNRRSSSA